MIDIRDTGPLPCSSGVENDFVPVIGLIAATNSVALAGAAVPPILLVTLAGGMVLTNDPGGTAGLPTTCTVNWHVPGAPPEVAATVPPVSVTDVAPGTAVTVPPQLLLSNPPAATVRPVGDVGKLSITETAVAIDVELLETMMVRMDVSPETTLGGVKDLLTSN